MKSIFRKATALVMLGSLLCGCQAKVSQPSASDRSDSVPVIFEETAAAIKSSSDKGDAVLGQTELKADPLKSKTVDFKADSKDATVRLTDQTGYTWELTVPGDALLLPCQITITPLSEIDGNRAIGKPTCGVQLVPDGLMFIKPAKLTVTGPNADRGLIITGNHDGSGLEFSMCKKDGQKMSADILHFSSALFVSNEDTVSKLHKLAESAYNDAVEKANKLFKEPLVIPPADPVEISCKDTDAQKKARQEYLDAYAASVMQPETDVIAQLLSAHNNVVLTEEEIKPLDQMLFNRLFNRLARKINELYKKYYPQKEYILPIFNAAVTIYHRAGLLSLGWRSDDLVSKFGPWFDTACKGYLEKIRAEHDFTVIPMYYYLARGVRVMNNDQTNVLGDLEKALTFKIEFEERLTTQKETFDLSGKAFQISRTIGGDHEFSISNGSGEYTGAKLPNGVTLVLPNTFNFSASIKNFLPCESSLTVQIDHFGAKTEVFSANGHQMGTGPIVDMAARWAFTDFMVSRDELATLPPPGPWYAFELPLKNKNELVANKTFSQSMSKGMVTYTLKVFHTPQ